jgi:DNA-binding NtrC family response regulator
MAEVLVVDDEASVRFLLRELLGELGHDVLEAEGGLEALAMLERGELADVELVLTDYAMPDLDGLTLLSRLRARTPELAVVLLTARGSERLAVQAIRRGAFDYVPKPFELDELEAIVTRALTMQSLRRDARRAALEATTGRSFVGEAPSFRAALERAERLARRDVPVLVRGETGTGKELLAALLHVGSPRREGPFVRFNCAAITEELAESELFGHARGAFTGAQRAHRGFFAAASGGTLVLDEVGELPPRLQPKLLRVLQSGEIQPVGGQVQRVDVRVVASTHRDLRELSRRGGFREDLYYRLAVVELEMPPLRDRRADIPLLARHFAARAAERFGLEHVRLSQGLLDALSRRELKGNVRELENLVTALVALGDGGLLDVDALEAVGQASAQRSAGAGSFRAQVEALERSLLEGALLDAGGNQSEAARKLGLSRATFLDKCKRHGVA